jgi:putative ABC transport system permease protein
VIGNALLKKYINFYFTLSFTVIGGIIYYMVVVIVLWLRLNSNDLKLFTAIVVALFLAVPYLRSQRISSFAKFKQKGAKHSA